MKIVSHKDQEFSQAVDRVCQRAVHQNDKVEKAVKTILDAVRQEGDKALQRLTWKFDRVRISPDSLRVTAKDVERAYAELPSSDIQALKYAANRIRIDQFLESIQI